MYLSEQFLKMSDGILLYTKIVLPRKEGKFPIVFMRSPYEDKTELGSSSVDDYKDNLFVKNGYALVYQHTRGKGNSEGICVPYNERQDGLDTLNILRCMDFYNGEIYITGESYLATVHLCYLDTNPSDIKGAALSIQTDRMFFRNYRNGCCYNYVK